MRYLTFLLLLFSCTVLGQKNNGFRLDSIPPEGALLDKGWKFHAGDNAAWAKADFDDSQWEAIDPSQDIYDVTPLKKAEIGWFRLRLTISPAVRNEQLALLIGQLGASEMYLNGRLIYRFGKVSADYDHEQTYFLDNKPFQFQPDPQPEQVIAVRYSFHHQNIYFKLSRTNPCLRLTIQSGKEAFDTFVTTKRITSGRTWLLLGLYLLLGIMYMLLYAYLKADKSYLYFGLYMLCYLTYHTIQELVSYMTDTSLRSGVFLVGFTLAIGGSVAVLQGTYLLVGRVQGWFGRVAIIYGFFAVPLLLWSYHWGGTLAMLLFLLVNTENIFNAMHGVRRRRPGAWVLVIQAILVYVVYGGAILMATLNKPTYAQLMTALNNLVIPLCSSVFLIGEFARTANNLRQRVVEVENLSAEKQQILTTQNETLEQQVTERTAELSHKNQELVIEAALERVRSRSLAMHSSEELKEVITIVSEQLQALGIQFDYVDFVVEREDKGWDCYNAIPVRGSIVSFIIPFLEHRVFNEYRTVRSQGLDFFSYTLTPNEKNEWLTHIFSQTTVKNASDEFKQLLTDSPGVASSVVVGLDIALSMGNYVGIPFNDTENAIFKRFGAVFNQAYVRFLDLQKAEAQAKEAQIEAALERVRSRSMAMQHSDQLQDIITVVSEQLQALGFAFDYVNFVLERADRGWDSYNATSNTPKTLRFTLPYTVSKSLNDHRDSIRQGLDFYTYTLTPDEKNEWYTYLFNHTDLKNVSDEYKQYVLAAPGWANSVVLWPDIALSIVNYLGIPYTDTENAIFKRFGAVFNQAYTRFKDLKKAEEQARQAIRTASLDRVRARIASMRTTQDLERITPLIWSELTILEVPFFRCGVFIVNQAEQRIHAFLSTPDGQARTQLNLPIDGTVNSRQIVESWQQQQVYTDRWNRQQLQQWVQSMVQGGQMDSVQEYEVVEEVKEAFSLQFIPFRQGMLYVGSQEPLSESELDLAQSLADAFSVAYARYEDFRQLEEAKVRVDAALTELKATQAQLIQKEKLASLGELTAGIAHEIQNPLNFVNNFSELSVELARELKGERLKGKEDRDEELENELVDDLIQNQEKINHHGKRASSIVRGMLEHSRISTGERQLTDMNQLADEYLRLSYHGMRAKDSTFSADYELIADKNLPKINVVAQEIGRVLLNLLNNAFYAVQEQGKRKTEHGISEYKPTVTLRTKAEKGQFIISVQDNGNGIPDAIKDKIFQPFFTTKPTGEGTGLGLSLAYDIVTKGHGGTMEAKTKEGEGSEFIVRLLC